MIINETTPLEKYYLGERLVYVKREDLSTNEPAPSLAKLRGIYKVIERAKSEGFKRIGVYDTRISKSGWACQAICQELGGISVVNFYPHLKEYGEELPLFQKRVIELGGEVWGMKGGRTAVLYSQALKTMKDIVIKPMPLGLVVPESVEATYDIAQTIPEEAKIDSVIVCIGSGMITAGLIMAFSKKVKRIIAISPGMNNNRQIKRIKEQIGDIPDNVEFKMSDMDYFSEYNGLVPFPCNKNYDAKAWKWLTENINSLEGNILFWNIGG